MNLSALASGKLVLHKNLPITDRCTFLRTLSISGKEKLFRRKGQELPKEIRTQDFATLSPTRDHLRSKLRRDTLISNGDQDLPQTSTLVRPNS